MNTSIEADIKLFKQKLADYKQAIDDDIKSYSQEIQKTTLEKFGVHSTAATSAYLNILTRGGKRLRGALVMAGYEIAGGKNKKMIVKAARAIEMIHSYILIIDDFQDKSLVRRHGKAAHVALADYHLKLKLAKDAEHFGASLAVTAALIANHEAQTVFTNLDAPDNLKLKGLSILNKSMITTGHGQINDIISEVLGDVSESDIDNILEWKTAQYSLLNPLQVGIALAGVEFEMTDGIITYAMHTGRAFQITDDILGTFGEESESGKSSSDDLREGKRTLLATYALSNTSPADKEFLLKCLGNELISETELDECKQIFKNSGALDYAKAKASDHVQQALKALNKSKVIRGEEGKQFLRGLANYILNRQS